MIDNTLPKDVSFQISVVFEDMKQKLSTRIGDDLASAILALENRVLNNQLTPISNPESVSPLRISIGNLTFLRPVDVMRIEKPLGDTVKIELTGDNVMKTVPLVPIMRKVFNLQEGQGLSGLELVIDPIPQSEDCRVRVNGYGEQISGQKERKVLGYLDGEEGLAFWSGSFAQFLGHPNWAKQSPTKQNPLPRRKIAETLHTAVAQNK